MALGSRVGCKMREMVYVVEVHNTEAECVETLTRLDGEHFNASARAVLYRS